VTFPPLNPPSKEVVLSIVAGNYVYFTVLGGIDKVEWYSVDKEVSTLHQVKEDRTDRY
jgi:hypothetical protein